MWKIIEITKGIVDKGGADVLGSAKYTCICKSDDPFNQKVVKVLTFVAKDDLAGQKVWDDFIATKQYPPVRINKFIVGDTSANPNDKPLPLFRLKNNTTGQLGPINSSISFHAAVDEKGNLYRGGTPRSYAIRLIEQTGEWVGETGTAEVETPV